MDPATLSLLLMAAGSAQGLFGAKDNSTRNLLNLLQRYGTPEMIMGDAQKYYQGFLNSPAYARAKSAVNISANQMAGQAANSIGLRGLSGSGVGSVLSALGSNTAGFKLADVQSQGWMQALQTAQAIDEARLGAARGLGAPRDIGQATLGGLLDWLGKGGLNSLLKKPGTTTTNGQSGAANGAAYGVYNPRPQGDMAYDPAGWFAQLAGKF